MRICKILRKLLRPSKKVLNDVFDLTFPTFNLMRNNRISFKFISPKGSITFSPTHADLISVS